MAETNVIRDFVDLDTTLIDAWIDDSPTIKWAIKEHVVLDDTLANVPDPWELQDELSQAFDELTTQRVDLLSNLPDDSGSDTGSDSSDSADTLITMEFQEMELKRLIAVKQLTSHERWSSDDDQE